jgi:hypothetical protein
MEDLPGSSADERGDLVLALRRGALAPLFQLDDHRVVAAGRPLAGDHEIQSLGGKGELVFEQDTMVPKVSILEDARHGPEGILPGGDFGGGGVVTVIVKKCVLSLPHLVQVGVIDELP